MQVEVVYVEPGQEFVASVEVSLGATVLEAIECSKLLKQYTTISLDKNSVGIFGKEVTLQTILQANDRVEVYRSLKKDPKDSRRLRAKVQSEN